MTRGHGTRTKYVRDRCRCSSCVKANSDYGKRRYRAGATYTWTPAQLVRAHLIKLTAAGIAQTRIARAAETTEDTVRRVLHCENTRQRIRADIAGRLLSLNIEDFEPKLPPEHGTNARFMRGCRCDACRDAKRTYDRRWKRKRMGWPAERLDDPPTTTQDLDIDEVAHLTRYGVSTEEIAARLGKTVRWVRTTQDRLATGRRAMAS